MSTWKPSEGLLKAELLVQILEVEARAAGSVITSVFRHRMVEMIAKTLDGGVVGTLTVSADDATKGTKVTTFFTNGHHPEDHIDDEAVHAIDVPEMPATQPALPAKTGKPGKKAGKRGRPSKAEVAARAAQ